MSADHAVIFINAKITNARCGNATASFPHNIYGGQVSARNAALKWAYDTGATHAEVHFGNDSIITKRLPA